MEASPWVLQDVLPNIENVETPLGRVDFDIDDTSITGYKLLEFSDAEILDYGHLESIPLEVEPVTVRLDNNLPNVRNTDLWGSVNQGISAASITARTQKTSYYDEFSETEALSNTAREATTNIDQAGSRLIKDTAFTSNVTKQYIIVRCSIDLGLGLKSVLFTFDRIGRAVAREDFIAASGLSRSFVLEAMHTVGACGETFRTMETYIERIHGNINKSPTSIAVASAINRIIIVIKQHILASSFEATIIRELHILFQLPGMLLVELLAIVESILASNDEIEAVNRLVAQAEKYDYEAEWFRPLASQILILAIKPFLEQVSWYIGLFPADPSIRSGNTRSEASLRAALSSFDASTSQLTLSSLFDEFQIRNIRVINRSLEMLKKYQPEHELLKPRLPIHGAGIGLELASNWSDVERIHENLASFIENAIAGSNNISPATIARGGSREAMDLNPYGSDLDSIQHNIMLSMEMLDHTTGYGSESQADNLIEATYFALHAEDPTTEDLSVQPALATLKIESFTPVLQAQSRSVTMACLKLAFQDHRLLHNLDVLHDFYLLGSGIFAVNLKITLFSWDLSSTRHARSQLNNGKGKLSAGQKSTWPPAGSELRVVLSEMLSECYRSSRIHGLKVPFDTLPGGLTFAARNLSQSELEASTDSISLNAFDFLRLQYQPPGALNDIITKSTLAKYDKIFQFLLRLSHVSFVVDRMCLAQRDPQYNSDRDKLRHTHSVYHFVSALATYVFTSVATVWSRFHGILTNIETQTQEPDFQGTYDIFQLCILHELMLDEIMAHLFLGHQSIQQALEETLTSVLQLAFAADSEQASAAFSVLESQSKVFLSTAEPVIDNGHLLQEVDALCSELKDAWKAGITSSGELQSLLFSFISMENLPVETSYDDEMDTS